MPIKVQSNLPAIKVLESENIFVMPNEVALRQDIRPLKILILNLMPCIFPILTIKVISLAQSPYNKYKARVESLLYFLGVVSSFFLIATILVWLRSTGEQIGWGFQLQSPVFVGVMIVIFTIIFLMLLDIVSLRNPFAGRVG